MKAHRLVLPLVLLLLLPSQAAASSGPFAGLVAEGEKDTHVFDNHPRLGACPQYITTYTVTLQYAPTTDALGLAVDGVGAVTGSNGFAQLSFQAGACTRFTLHVTGESVAEQALYAVTVRSGGPGALGDPA